MAVRLRFKHQDFQMRAAESVCEIFTGQERIGSQFDEEGTIRGLLTGFGNSNITLSESEILANLQRVQSENGLKVSESLDGMKFTVEMETGTGKTYTYFKTIHELYRRYGWGKYIIVVPSIAIREGVAKTFRMTENHFREDYESNASAFIYDSSDMGRVRSFVNNPEIDIMIINSQAFSASRAESRRIKTPSEDLSYRKPIDVIAKVRPVVIIDEPQSVEGEQTMKSLEEFSPLFTLRYSATPRHDYNMVYRLDAVDAYNQKLVKKICVTGISVKNISAQGGYVYLKGIIKSEKDPAALLEFDYRGKNGTRRITRKVSEGMNLYDESGGLEEYKAGYIVRMIDALNMTVEFLNGIKISPGEISGDLNGEQLRRTQIRETIEQHLRKERQLFSQGIKVLSLFFIDRVDKYRVYQDDEALPGIYAKIFEDEYRDAVRNFQSELEGSYAGYIASIKPEETHAGYFSVDKKNHMTDSKTVSKKDDTSDDISAFDLIMRDKERLLSLGEPVRFIFSHSALREGWDNPNVFQICALRNSTSDIRRRQEVGRGLRLCVNQEGVRIDSSLVGNIVQEINELTVIAGESYSIFAGGLQQEYDEILGGRGNVPVVDTRKKRVAHINRRISESPEFREFMRIINIRQVYSVKFDEGTFIRRCVDDIDTELNIARTMMIIERGKMTADDSAVAFTKESRRTMIADPESGRVKYDVVGRLAAVTELTRKVICEILKRIDRSKFAMYRINPEVFITETARIIRGAKNSLSSENIFYKPVDDSKPATLAESFDVMRSDSMTAETPKRGLYDITPCDSNVEREFVFEAEREDSVFAHVKLPERFSVPTPGSRYTPDWVIIMEDGRKLIAETKGTKEMQEIRPSEKAKNLCARKFFRSAGIDYEVENSFDGLMSHIAGRVKG